MKRELAEEVLPRSPRRRIAPSLAYGRDLSSPLREPELDAPHALI